MLTGFILKYATGCVTVAVDWNARYLMKVGGTAWKLVDTIRVDR